MIKLFDNVTKSSTSLFLHADTFYYVVYIFNIDMMVPIKITHLLSIDKQYNFEVEFVLSVAKSFFCTEQDLH